MTFRADAARETAPAAAPLGHNGGPPLDEHAPEWGTAPIREYFCWKAAHRRSWRRVPRETALRALRRAESLGLTYREYALEIMDRGVWLQAGDAARVAAIKRARGPKK